MLVRVGGWGSGLVVQFRAEPARCARGYSLIDREDAVEAIPTRFGGVRPHPTNAPHTAEGWTCQLLEEECGNLLRFGLMEAELEWLGEGGRFRVPLPPPEGRPWPRIISTLPDRRMEQAAEDLRQRAERCRAVGARLAVPADYRELVGIL